MARTFAAHVVDPKDPQESKLYTMDWSGELTDGATISTSSWTIDGGLAKVTDGIVTGSLKTTIKVSGGQAGADYACTNTVTTSDGETLERTGIVRVRER